MARSSKRKPGPRPSDALNLCIVMRAWFQIAAGSTWCRTVCQRVAPGAYDAWRIEPGTARNDSCAARITIGSTTSESVSATFQDTRRRPGTALSPTVEA